MTDFFPSKIKVVSINNTPKVSKQKHSFINETVIPTIDLTSNENDNQIPININKIEEINHKQENSNLNISKKNKSEKEEKINESKLDIITLSELNSKIEYNETNQININENNDYENEKIDKKNKKRNNKNKSSSELNSISSKVLENFFAKKKEENNSVISFNKFSNNNLEKLDKIVNSNNNNNNRLGSLIDIEKRKNVSNYNINEITIAQNREKIGLSVDEIKNKIEAKNKNKQCTLDFFKFTVPDRNFNKNKNLKELENDTIVNICSWNVNGLRRMLDNETLNDFFKQESPDFLCLNETKVDQDSLIKEKYFQIQSESYGSYWNCSKLRKGYSGVAVFTRFQPLNVSYGIDIEEHDQEGRVITLEYLTFYLIVAYIPNSGPELKRLEYRINHWDKAFYNYVYCLSNKKNVILAGDLNVLHKDPDLLNGKRYVPYAGGTIEERENFNNFLLKGFYDSFIICNEDKERFGFDYFIISEEAKSKVIESDILVQYEGSDHYPIKLLYHNFIE